MLMAALSVAVANKRPPDTGVRKVQVPVQVGFD